MSEMVDFSIGRDRITSRWGITGAKPKNHKKNLDKDVVICVEDGMRFKSFTSCATQYDFGVATIFRSAKEKIAVNGHNFRRILADGTIDDTNIVVKVKRSCKKIVCVTDGKVFNSTYDAELHYEVPHGTLHRYARGEKLWKGKEFRYLEEV